MGHQIKNDPLKGVVFLFAGAIRTRSTRMFGERPRGLKVLSFPSFFTRMLGDYLLNSFILSIFLELLFLREIKYTLQKKQPNQVTLPK